MLPTFVAPPAPRAIFGASYDASVARIDEAWLADNREAWGRRFEDRAKQHAELAALDDAATTGSLEQPRALRRAKLTEALRTFDEARPLYEAILSADADHAPSLYALGKAALNRGEDTGLAMLERCMEIDDDAIMPACEAAVEYLVQRGRVDEAGPYVHRYDRRRHLLGLAASERDSISPKDNFPPHSLNPEVIEAILVLLRQHPTVGRAYLVRRDLRHLAERPSYVLAVVLRPRAVSAAGASVLLQEIADHLPLPHVTVLRLTRYGRLWTWRRLARRSALVYRA